MTDVPPPVAPVPASVGGQAVEAPPAELVRSPLSDGEWHRLHPLSPLLRGGLFLLVVIGIVVANLRDRLIAMVVPIFVPEEGDELVELENSGDPVDFIVANNLIVIAILVVLAVLIVLLALFYLSWRFHSFRITGDDVEVRSGVLFRTQRRAPLDRVQGVNLVRPMIARLLGMAKLEVVGAGTDANVKLEYLSTANAEAVRADILRLASGRRLADAAAPGAKTRPATLGETVSRGITGLIEGDEARVDEPESVVDIPVGRLIASHLLSTSTLFFLLAFVVVAIGAIFGITWLLFAYIPALIGLGAYWVRSIMRALRYSIAPTPDGVRITFGLLTTTTEIVPPGRIHAIEVSQPILWRPFGWWRISMNRLSGRSAGSGSAEQFTTALPVGTAADVERVLRLLKPAVSEAEWRLVVSEGAYGPAEGDSFTTMPRRAWFLRPLSWRRNGFRLTDDLLLLRRGLIWRSLSILPLARLQSLGIHQGPLDRALRVASLRAHVVAGPVSTSLGAIDRTTALTLFADVERAAVRASEEDRSHRWAVALDDERTDAAPGAPAEGVVQGESGLAAPGEVAVSGEAAPPGEAAVPGEAAASSPARAPARSPEPLAPAASPEPLEPPRPSEGTA